MPHSTDTGGFNQPYRARWGGFGADSTRLGHDHGQLTLGERTDCKSELMTARSDSRTSSTPGFFLII